MCLPVAGAHNPNYNRGLNNVEMISLPFKKKNNNSSYTRTCADYCTYLCIQKY